MTAETAGLIRKSDGAAGEHPTNLPPDVAAELEALSRLNDDVLWAVA